MDNFDEIQESEFVTDTDDQDSLDEKIESEQRLENHQLWLSFQNAACCITELYKDRVQPNISPWIPFQNAASNLTTLYKDCIESQKRFAKIGYQIGRQRRMRDLNKMLKKHKLTQKQLNARASDHPSLGLADMAVGVDKSSGHNNVSSILAVNQLNLDFGDTPSNSTLAQPQLNQFNPKMMRQPTGQQWSSQYTTVQQPQHQLQQQQQHQLQQQQQQQQQQQFQPPPLKRRR